MQRENRQLSQLNLNSDHPLPVYTRTRSNSMGYLTTPHRKTLINIKPNYEVRICVSEEERSACWQLMNKLLLQPPYNASSIRVINDWLGPADSLVYVGAFNSLTGELVGALRLMLDYDPTRHSNISGELLEYCRSGQRLVDIGVYISSGRRDKASIFKALLVGTTRYLLNSPFNGVYIQVQEAQVATYTRLGFSPASETFQPLGWSHRWRGMFIQVDRITQCYSDPSYQKYWQKKTCTKLKVSFWSRAMENITPIKDMDRPAA